MSLFQPNSLRQRLSFWLAVQSLLGLLIVCLIVYVATSHAFKARQLEDLSQKQSLIQHLASEALSSGDEAMLRHKLRDFMVGHSEFGLMVRQGSGVVFFEEALPEPASARRTVQFELSTASPGRRPFQAELSLDVQKDIRVLQRISIVLIAAAVCGALLISFGGFALVWLGLRPLRELSSQVKALAADSLHRRLDGSSQPAELAPLIERFNDLLGRLDRSYEHLEGFNADVAHELLTPLATLTSGAELALSSAKNIEELRDVLGSSLEDLQRITGIVHDMLFLSQADRGAIARRVPTESLAEVARQVAAYHDAVFEEADVRLEIVGDSSGDFDVALLRRAVSNLLSNAVRYATRGSVVRILVEKRSEEEVTIVVENHGVTINPGAIPRLFDRFFRGDSSRSNASRNHGLGLSIVSAIARMHGGQPLASSAWGKTDIGMVLKRSSS
jgi:two-component system heavy metal sensor histidine kinase CusS